MLELPNSNKVTLNEIKDVLIQVLQKLNTRVIELSEELLKIIHNIALWEFTRAPQILQG